MDSPVEGYPAPGTLDDVLGFELLELTQERVRGRFAADKRVQQPFGLVHAGAYMALAESLASWGTFAAVADDGNIAVGQANDNSFFRPVIEGTVHAEGASIHRGRTSWVWDFRFTDDQDRLCAVSRVTIAVRPAPDR
ncbi:MAG TPA: PaaI family thioesterase [Thermoleophilaceae bacterium]|nr:PaaI family thioesterase [Thermoleophilaceae bacterium]